MTFLFVRRLLSERCEAVLMSSTWLFLCKRVLMLFWRIAVVNCWCYHDGTYCCPTRRFLLMWKDTNHTSPRQPSATRHPANGWLAGCHTANRWPCVTLATIGHVLTGQPVGHVSPWQPVTTCWPGNHWPRSSSFTWTNTISWRFWQVEPCVEALLALSPPPLLPYGVPQGSVFEPLLVSLLVLPPGFIVRRHSVLYCSIDVVQISVHLCSADLISKCCLLRRFGKTES